MTSNEYILCAAIWVDDGVPHIHQPRNILTGIVIGGWRHHNCIATAQLLYKAGTIPEEQRAGKNQGFITSLGRYVDREEAALLAIQAGQVPSGVTSLTSEHLYYTKEHQ